MSSHLRPIFTSPTYALFVLAFSGMALGESSSAKATLTAAKELIELMADRLELAESVARHKWNEALPVEDDKSDIAITELNASVAKELGLDATLAESFTKSQLGVFKERQRQLFASWKEAGVYGFDEVPDLTSVVRPQLEKNVKDQLKKLSELKATLCSSAMIALLNEMASTTFARRGIEKSLAKTLFDSLDIPTRELSGACPTATAPVKTDAAPTETHH